MRVPSGRAHQVHRASTGQCPLPWAFAFGLAHRPIPRATGIRQNLTPRATGIRPKKTDTLGNCSASTGHGPREPPSVVRARHNLPSGVRIGAAAGAERRAHDGGTRQPPLPPARTDCIAGTGCPGKGPAISPGPVRPASNSCLGGRPWEGGREGREGRGGRGGWGGAEEGKRGRERWTVERERKREREREREREGSRSALGEGRHGNGGWRQAAGGPEVEGVEQRPHLRRPHRVRHPRKLAPHQLVPQPVQAPPHLPPPPNAARRRPQEPPVMGAPAHGPAGASLSHSGRGCSHKGRARAWGERERGG